MGSLVHEQIKVGTMDEFCYIIGCRATGDAAVLDPGGDEHRVLERVAGLELQVKYILNTHHHADHTCGNRTVQQRTGAKIVIHRADAGYIRPAPDIVIEDQKTLGLGELEIDLIHTPGHTRGGVCYLVQGQLFTGDTLFVGDSGRTDLEGGDRPTLGQSLRTLMARLPEDTVVWPGHDYGPTTSSTLAWEKRNNVNAVEYGYFIE